VKTIVPLLELLLALISGGLALLLLAGKIRIEIVRRPRKEEPEEQEVAATYVRPLEQPKPPTLVEEAPKRRRGRPRKVRPVSTLIPPTTAME
jgi:hypothetical protein